MTVEQIELHSKGHYVGYQMNLFSLSDVNNNDLINFKGGKPYNSPQEFADALSKGSKNGGVSAIIAELPYVKIFLDKYSDDYSMVKSMPSTNGFGFVSVASFGILIYSKLRIKSHTSLLLLSKVYFRFIFIKWGNKNSVLL